MQSQRGHEIWMISGLKNALTQRSFPGVAVPKGLSGDVRTAPVLAIDRVVDAEDMPATVKEILKIS
ncbi:MAG: hypothetical protein ACLRZ5_08205 [Ruminococcus sp.]